MTQQQKTAKVEQNAALDLQAFFPYRLAVLYDEVSRCVAQVYSERFKLTRHQWRILAMLGGHDGLTAKEITQRTRMEKMQVSRVVSQLTDSGHINRQVDAQDKRHQRLTLARKGRDLYREIVPHVCAREDFILSALSLAEQHQLDGFIEKLLQRSQELQSYG